MQHGGSVSTDVVGASPLIIIRLVGYNVLNTLWTLPAGFMF